MNVLNMLKALDIIGFHTMSLLISLFWQSTLIIGVAALFVFILRHRSASIRHLIWASMLCLLPVVPLLLWLASEAGTPQVELKIIPKYSAPVSTVVITPVNTSPETPTIGNHEPSGLSTVRLSTVRVTDYPWAFTFMGYTLVSMFFLLLITVGRRRIRRWIRNGKVITDSRTIGAFNAARDRFDIKRSFVAVEFGNLPAPITFGTFHPVVLLPSGFTDNLSDKELMALAVHEAAHIKRNDSLILTIVSLVRALFFFHPLVWIASREVEILAENACDDIVLVTVENPVAYAEMLIRLAGKLPKRQFTTELAAGFIFSKHSFLRRVEVILSYRKDRIRKLSRCALTGIAIAVVAAFLMILSVPVGEVKETKNIVEIKKGKVCNIPQEIEDSITEFTGGKKEVIDSHELAGVVYDETGNPLEGVLVDAWTWNPGSETQTDKQGRFKLTDLSRERKVEIRFSKEGYSPELIVRQETGVGNIIIRLGSRTYFEGRILDPGGQPVPDALIRANQGPKRADGVYITSIWTETRSKKNGNYRLYVDTDTYDIQLSVADVGVARIQDQTIERDEAKKLDINLERGVDFRAKIVNSRTKKPVEGVRLWHWQHEGVEGTSGRDGLIEIKGMLPGSFVFQIEGDGIGRWWTEDTTHSHQRRMIGQSGWQRNFDHLEFDLETGMDPVLIEVEDGVKITGRVLDPEGNTIAGATVAPAHTGTGNSITGDTRYSVLSEEDGSFEMLLPASGEAEYNLVVHDGDYREWRTWANGVLDPIKTRPGQVIRDITISLTRPCTVRGNVKDTDGNPMADHTVRVHDAEKKGNRYYDPMANTDENGNFTMRFIRPGTHWIIGTRTIMPEEYAPDNIMKRVTLKPGEELDGINLIGYGRDELLKAMKKPE